LTAKQPFVRFTPFADEPKVEVAVGLKLIPPESPIESSDPGVVVPTPTFPVETMSAEPAPETESAVVDAREKIDA
jgi:hypothetical protein